MFNELGISKSAYSGWKAGGEPTNRTKKQLADYFGVTVSQLVLGEIKPKKPVTDDDELNEYLELAESPAISMLLSLCVSHGLVIAF